MELRQIKELMSAMGRTGMRKLTVKEGEFELTLEHGDAPVHIVEAPRVMEVPLPSLGPGRAPAHESMGAAPLPAATAPEKGSADEGAAVGTAQTFISSPMVGTLYMAPSPDDPIFVKVGDRVEEDTVVCIIEAMKVMNEVKAGVSGVVEEILMSNMSPVEFGTKLFRVNAD